MNLDFSLSMPRRPAIPAEMLIIRLSVVHAVIGERRSYQAVVFSLYMGFTA